MIAPINEFMQFAQEGGRRGGRTRGGSPLGLEGGRKRRKTRKGKKGKKARKTRRTRSGRK
tara:strand:+ start:440 stop:619 length:180 start_codon:yes stop_codon:yes gene_type:complete